MKALFVHVPRCGGMSFYYFLEELYGKANCIRFGDKVSSSQFLNWTDDHSDYACISGHIAYRFFKDRGCERQRFTIAFVRNPVERELSAYNHINKNDYAEHDELRNMTQAAYWKYFSKSPEIHNLQANYFSEDSRFESAKATILENRICVFDINQINCVAQEIKNFAHVAFSPAHTNGTGEDAMKLSAKGIQTVEKYCQEDIMLHAWANENSQYFLNLLRSELWRSYLITKT